MRKLALPSLFAILAAVATCTGARAYVGTQLDAIALLTPTSGNVITGNGSTWTSAAPAGGGSSATVCIADYTGGGQTITTATETTLLFDHEISDNSNLHSTSSNTGRFLCNAAGVWRIDVTTRLRSDSAGTFNWLRVERYNVSDVQQESRTVAYDPPTSLAIHHLKGQAVFRCLSTDYVIVTLKQDSGGDRIVDGSDTVASFTFVGS